MGKLIEKYLEIRKNREVSIYDDTIGESIPIFDKQKYINELQELKESIINSEDKEALILEYLYNTITEKIDSLKLADDCEYIFKNLYMIFFKMINTKSKRVQIFEETILLNVKHILLNNYKINDNYVKLLYSIADECENCELYKVILKIQTTSISTNKVKLTKKIKYNQQLLREYDKRIVEYLIIYLNKLNIQHLKTQKKILSLDIDRVLNDYVAKYERKVNKKIILKTVDNRFSNLITDAAYFKGSNFDEDGDILFINKNMLFNKISYEQLDMIFTHEIFPGHLYHLELGNASKYNLFQKIKVSLESLEGWAMCVEEEFSRKKEVHRSIFILNFIRRLCTCAITIRFLLGVDIVKSKKFYSELIKTNIKDKNVVEFLERNLFINENSMNYILGYFKIVDNSMGDIYQYGAIDLDIMKKIIIKENNLL